MLCPTNAHAACHPNNLPELQRCWDQEQGKEAAKIITQAGYESHYFDCVVPGMIGRLEATNETLAAVIRSAQETCKPYLPAFIKSLDSRILDTATPLQAEQIAYNFLTVIAEKGKP